MTSLEVLLLTAISLIIIFAALPYVISTLYASMAPLEYRNAVAYVLAFADGLEADFGMAGSRKYFPLPNFVYGSFGAVNRTYTLIIRCGSTSLNRYGDRWNVVEVWYNSTYLVDGPRLYRGVDGGLIAFVGDTMVAVNATPPGRLKLYFRPFVVNGTDEVYIYFVSSRFYARGRYYLTYEVSGTLTVDGPRQCGGKLEIRVSDGVRQWSYTTQNVVKNVYIVNQTVAVELR